MEPTTPDARLLVEHREFIRRLAMSLLRDPHAAEDVAQDVLVRALEHPPRPGNLTAWLGRVARNVSISRLRSEQRRAKRERTVAAGQPLPPVDEAVGSIELQQRVVAVVLDLPEPYRSTLIHRYFNDLGPTEIAKRSNVPRETVKTRLRRALEMVRVRLDEEHRGDRRTWSMLLLPLLPRGGGGASAPVIGGALIVGTKLKIVAAVLILAVIAGLGVERMLRPDDHRTAPEPPARAVEIATAPVPGDKSPSHLPPIDFTTVDRDLDLHGTVVDAEGQPVAGAEIRTVKHPFRRMAALVEATFTEVEGPATESAGDGTFALRLTRGEQVDLQVNATDFAPVIRQACLAGERVRIVLSGGTPLTIRAVTEAGEPIEGIHLRFVDFGMRWNDTDGGAWNPPDGVTGPEGTCTFERSVALSHPQLIAWHEEYGLKQVQSFRYPDSGEFEFILEGGKPVTGTVRDAMSGVPVASARVTIVPFYDWFSVETDERGRFTWPIWRGGLNGEMGALFVLAEGYALTLHQVVPGDDQKILLVPGGRVEGRLVNPDGEPVAAALVTTLGGSKMDIDSHDCRSGPDGRFALTGLLPRFPHTLIALAPGYGRTLLDLDLPQTGEMLRLGDLVLPMGRRIEGRLLDGAGVPLTGETVTLTGANADRGRLRPDGRPLDSKYGTRERCVTDDLGRFRFRDLAPGSYELTVRSSRGMTLNRAVCLAADADIFDADLRPQVTGDFSIRVVDESGDPVPGAIVTLFSLPGGRPTGSTNQDGWACLDVPDGAREAYMSVKPPEGRSMLAVSRPLRLDEDKTTVVLEAADTVAGTVLDPKGEPLPYAVIVATWEGRGGQSVPADATGRFQVQVPARGRIELTLSGQVGNGRRPITGRLSGVAPGTRDVVLRAKMIDTDRTLRVRVLTPSGESLAGIGLAVPGPGVFPVTNEQGVAEISNLPGKEIEVMVYDCSHHEAFRKWAPPERIRVVPAGQEVLLRFRAAAPISGTVRLPDGSPAFVVVVARDAAGRHITQVGTNATDGTFVLPIPTALTGGVSLEIIPSSNRADPAYKDLRNVRMPDIQPGREDIDIQLTQSD